MMSSYMRKFIFVLIIFCVSGLLFVAIITYGKQTNISNYYPAPTGNYTKAHFINNAGQTINYTTAAGQVACFCARIPGDTSTQNNGNGVKPTNNCDVGENVNGYTYPNAGTIFVDAATGYLEVCKKRWNSGFLSGFLFHPLRCCRCQSFLSH